MLVALFQNLTWVNDTQYLMAPKGLTGEKLAVVLDLMAFLLQPEQQALTYDKGYFYRTVSSFRQNDTYRPPFTFTYRASHQLPEQ